MNKGILVQAFLISLILLAPVANADELWFYNSQYLVLDVNISSGINIASMNSRPDIDFIIANLSFFPKEVLGQEILEMDFEPEPKHLGDSAVFEWVMPEVGRIPLVLRSKVRIKHNPAPIDYKIGFPISSIPDEVSLYTEPSKIIDINDDIVNLASELASGRDDLVDVVDTIAVWVNTNIQYNLSTITADASQKASWVFENREGVCDELTSLFISLLRSLGIPARFVAGLSYTESPLFPDRWGPHGWAEVYFPGYGWVPYDVTYGQYGWIDSTHIFTKASADAEKIISSYLWQSKKTISVDLEKMNTDVTVIGIGPKKDKDILITLEALHDSIGFGSYNLIIAQVVNLRHYYVSKDIYLSNVNRITLIDEPKKHLLLRPGEVKVISWVIKADADLSRRYIYTFPFHAFTALNETGQVSFTSVSDARTHNLEEILTVHSAIQEDELRAYSKNLDLECLLEKQEYYQYEKPVLQCFMKNTGNVFFRDLELCFRDDCRLSHLGITQQKAMNFTIRTIKPGLNEIPLSVKNEQISKETLISFFGMDAPRLAISGVEFPAAVHYSDSFKISFNAEKQSESVPKDAAIHISGNRLDVKNEYSASEGITPFTIDLKGRDLVEGVNEISIVIYYTDKNSREYSVYEEIEISLVDVTLFQRMLLFLRSLFM